LAAKAAAAADAVQATIRAAQRENIEAFQGALPDY